MNIGLFTQQGMGEVLLSVLAKSGHVVSLFLPQEQLTFSGSLTSLAQYCNVKIYGVGTFENPATIADLAAKHFDLIIAGTFPRRFPKEVLDLPVYGAFNVHPSLLPDYRGADPCFWAIRNGERQGGVTVHLMDECFDTGPIVVRRPVSIADDETSGSHYLNLLKILPGLIDELLCLCARGDVRVLASPQVPANDKKAPKVSLPDLMLSPAMSVIAACNLVRAANPFYGACFSLNGKLVKIWQMFAGEPVASLLSPIDGFAHVGDGELWLRFGELWARPDILQLAHYEIATNEVFIRKFM